MMALNEAAKAAVCSLCSWPEEFGSSADLWREKCNQCQALAEQQQVEAGIFDTEEIHHGCTVQIWSNSRTGETSVGWWKD